MKKFDVYALGNALVDIEYHSNPHTLVEMGIDKGVMTLIDEQRQNSLIAQLGESHESMTCGGSAANTIIALAQMGAKTHFDCRVSNDMTGQVFARDLHESGVNSNLDYKPLPAGITGKCLVFVTPDADRTMNTFLGVSGELDVSDIDKQAIKQSEYVYIEGYLASADNTRDAAIEVRRIAEARGVKTSLTLSDPNMVKFFRESLEAMIGDQVDLLFANEDEALEHLAQLRDHPRQGWCARIRWPEPDRGETEDGQGDRYAGRGGYVCRCVPVRPVPGDELSPVGRPGLTGLGQDRYAVRPTARSQPDTGLAGDI
jgi:sugar/nucleoside kinase (ribokinase family)